MILPLALSLALSCVTDPTSCEKRFTVGAWQGVCERTIDDAPPGFERCLTTFRNGDLTITIDRRANGANVFRTFTGCGMDERGVYPLAARDLKGASAKNRLFNAVVVLLLSLPKGCPAGAFTVDAGQMGGILRQTKALIPSVRYPSPFDPNKETDR